MTLASQWRPLRTRACTLPESHFCHTTSISIKYILVYFRKRKKQWLVNNGCLYTHQQSLRGFLLTLSLVFEQESGSSFFFPLLPNHLLSLREFSNKIIYSHVLNIQLQQQLPILGFSKCSSVREEKTLKEPPSPETCKVFTWVPDDQSSHSTMSALWRLSLLETTNNTYNVSSGHVARNIYCR